jgi:hypothetical protein
MDPARENRLRQAAYWGLSVACIPIAAALDHFLHPPQEFAWLFPTIGFLGLILFSGLALRRWVEGTERLESARRSRPVDPEATRRSPVATKPDHRKERPGSRNPDTTVRWRR